MAKRAKADQAASRRASEFWRARSLEFLKLADSGDGSMYAKAAETANKLAEHFEREVRREHFSTDFCLVVDGEPVYAEIDGKEVDPRTFPRRRLGRSRP